MQWDLVSFINRSKNRKVILLHIKKPSTPTILAKELNLYRSVISRSLLALEKKGLVKCLNPEDKKQRYYKLTRKGEELRKSIEKMR